MKTLPLLLSAVLITSSALRAEDHKLSPENTTVKFTGTEDYTAQTSFVIDDTALTVS